MHRPTIGIDARKLTDGGIGRYIGEIVRRLPAILPDVRFVAAVKPADVGRLRALAPGIEAIAVEASGYSLAEHRELPRAFRRAGCDLVHVPHYVLPRLLRLPAVVTVHDLIHLRLPRTPVHRWYAALALTQVRRRAALVLTPSEAVARDVAERTRIDRRRIRVIPNGVAGTFLRGRPDAEEIEAFRRRLGLVGPYVLNVTNGLPHKGLDRLLRALGSLPGLRLALVGPGAGIDAARRAVAASPCADRVSFLGVLSDEDLRLAYAASAVVAIPSLYEGFGLPALEAMATGGVVVASDAGGLPEAVGDAGLLVPAGSVECLRGALYRVTSEIEPSEREALIQRGLSQAQRFPWDRTARETCAAYEQVLSRAA